jgi:hypothetical protein
MTRHHGLAYAVPYSARRRLAAPIFLFDRKAVIQLKSASLARNHFRLSYGLAWPESFSLWFAKSHAKGLIVIEPETEKKTCGF